MAAPLCIERTPLLDTAAIRAAWVHCAGLSREPTPEMYEPDTQIVLTQGGAFVYYVGRAAGAGRCRGGHLVDANRIVFVRAGQTSADSGVGGAAVSYLVLTPDPALLDERRLPETAIASPGLQIASARWAAVLRTGAVIDPLVVEEEAIRITDAALAGLGPSEDIAPFAAARLARRARALFAPVGRPIGVTALARQLAVSPAYLSEAFRRAEGLPVLRYQLRLRLVRALAELPHTDDLTALAFELGFSSHSHFTTAFRTTMGMTPSQYRHQVRTAAIRSPGSTQRRIQAVTQGPIEHVIQES